MTSYRPKLWTAVGVAALLTAAACSKSGEHVEQAPAGTTGSADAVGAARETPTGESRPA